MSARALPGAAPLRPRRRRRAPVLAAGLLVLLLAEVWILVQLEHLIGAWGVVALLAVEALAGVLVLRRAGRGALAALRVPVRSPAELAAGPRGMGRAAAVAAGGLLLLVPGVLTDVAGLLCLLPPTRALLLRLARSWLRRRVDRAVASAGGGRIVVGDVRVVRPPGRAAPTAHPRRPAGGEDVVEGEVVDDDPGAGAR